MPFCTSCGSSITQDQHSYCGACGAPTKTTISNPTIGAGQVSQVASSQSMKIVWAFAFIGGFVAFLPIPGVSFILIPMEIFLLYKIASRHNAFDFVPLLGFTGLLLTISIVLKGLAAALTAIPLIGWMANSLVAFGFIMTLGHMAESHYSKHRRRAH
jgi:hypothetical protein